MRALNALARAFPTRFCAFALTNDRDRAERHDRDALHGKGMVYVHSKVLIADDRQAIVSSANLNGRSLRWDYEAGLIVDEAAFAAGLRRALWNAHLGEVAAGPDPLADPGDALALWRDLAAKRKQAGIWTAKAGIVPFPLERAKRFAKRSFLLPEELV